jgi:hypothetical protein
MMNILEKVWQQTANRSWYTKQYTSNDTPVVIGGCARSGTTLMRVMLDSHPNIYCGPESGLLYFKTLTSKRIRRLSQVFEINEKEVRTLAKQSDSFPKFIEVFFNVLKERAEKPRWGDKTPQNVLHIHRIFRIFPKSRFIHMIRDGRDVSCSLRTFPQFKIVDGQRIELDTHNPLEACIKRWVHDVQIGMRWRGDPRYIEVRYEDLVEHIEGTAKRILEFLEEPWSENVTQFHKVQSESREDVKMVQNPGATQPVYSSAYGRWRREFSEEDKELFKRLGGNLLGELGYESSDDW